MNNGKDSAEVVRFLILYAKLKEWCDDQPNAVFELASMDEKFKDLCIGWTIEQARLLAIAARAIRRNSSIPLRSSVRYFIVSCSVG
jgi:hypothetical protein